MPTSRRPLPRPGDPLRVAYLVYRGNPHCGGQGVYTRHLTRELAALGHHVEVYSGQPWPELDDPVRLNEVASLDLYRRENPFRVPWPHEFRSAADLHEFGIMCAAGFPEPLHVLLRARRMLQQRSERLRPRARQPVSRQRPAGHDRRRLADDRTRCTTRSRSTATSSSSHATNPFRKLTLRRWYGFLNMQMQRRPPAAAPPDRLRELQDATSARRWASTPRRCTSCTSASTRSSSARFPTSNGSRVA